MRSLESGGQLRLAVRSTPRLALRRLFVERDDSRVVHGLQNEDLSPLQGACGGRRYNARRSVGMELLSRLWCRAKFRVFLIKMLYV